MATINVSHPVDNIDTITVPLIIPATTTTNPTNPNNPTIIDIDSSDDPAIVSLAHFALQQTHLYADEYTDIDVVTNLPFLENAQMELAVVCQEEIGRYSGSVSREFFPKSVLSADKRIPSNQPITNSTRSLESIIQNTHRKLSRVATSHTPQESYFGGIYIQAVTNLVDMVSEKAIPFTVNQPLETNKTICERLGLPDIPIRKPDIAIGYDAKELPMSTVDARRRVPFLRTRRNQLCFGPVNDVVSTIFPFLFIELEAKSSKSPTAFIKTHSPMIISLKSYLDLQFQIRNHLGPRAYEGEFPNGRDEPVVYGVVITGTIWEFHAMRPIVVNGTEYFVSTVIYPRNDILDIERCIEVHILLRNILEQALRRRQLIAKCLDMTSTIPFEPAPKSDSSDDTRKRRDRSTTTTTTTADEDEDGHDGDRASKRPTTTMARGVSDQGLTFTALGGTSATFSSSVQQLSRDAAYRCMLWNIGVKTAAMTENEHMVSGLSGGTSTGSDADDGSMEVDGVDRREPSSSSAVLSSLDVRPSSDKTTSKAPPSNSTKTTTPLTTPSTPPPQPPLVSSVPPPLRLEEYSPTIRKRVHQHGTVSTTAKLRRVSDSSRATDTSAFTPRHEVLLNEESERVDFGIERSGYEHSQDEHTILQDAAKAAITAHKVDSARFPVRHGSLGLGERV